MSEFDPYRKWLGIPAKDQPPHHYRLLGIELFESDHDVIDAHANKQMSYLQGCVTGDHADLAEKILDEMASARLCLLNSKKKEEYDAALRNELQKKSKQGVAAQTAAPTEQSEGSAAAAQLPVAKVLPQPAAPAAPQVAAVAPKVSIAKRTSRRKTNHRATVVVAGLTAVAIVGLVIVVAVLASGKPDTVADNNNGSKALNGASRPAGDPASPDERKKSSNKAGSAASESRPTRDDTDSTAGTSAENTPSQRSPDATSGATSEKHPDGDGAAGADSSRSTKDTVEGDKTDVPGTGQPAPPSTGQDSDDPSPATVGNSPDRESPGRRLLSVPGEDVQAAARKLVEDAFSSEHKNATSNEQKSELAAKMLEEANLIEDDVASRFVMLDVAAKIAVDANDVETALLATTELERRFEFDWIDRKAGIVGSLAKATQPASKQVSLATSAITVTQEAMDVDRFGLAVQLARVARDASRKARNPQLLAVAVAQLKEVEAVAKTYDDTKAAIAKLESVPDDRNANLDVGKFYCFWLNRWNQGLPLLAKGSDPRLESLARKDTSGPIEAKARALIGDAWWELGESYSDTEQRHIRQRAELWYQLALEELTAGLVRRKVEQRLESLREEQARLAAARQEAEGTSNDLRKKPTFNEAFDFQNPERFSEFFEAGGPKWRLEQRGLNLLGPRGSWVVTKHQYKGDFALQLSLRLGKYGEAKILCCGEKFDIKGQVGPQNLKVAIERRGDTLVFARNGKPIMVQLKQDQRDKPTRIRINYGHWDTRESYLLVQWIGITAVEASKP